MRTPATSRIPGPPTRPPTDPPRTTTPARGDPPSLSATRPRARILPRASPVGLGAPLALLGALATGCVTQTRPASSPPARAPSHRAEDVPGLDLAAISSAPDARTLNTAITVAFRPLGGVPYDGQVLPLVSPDARFVATQAGEPPTWPALLAVPDAPVPDATRIEIYDISRSPPRRVRPQVPLPPALLLTRSADRRGFLVESPRPDGSRRLGLIEWETGTLRWLVREPITASHAVFSSDAGVLFLYARADGARALARATDSGWTPIDIPDLRPLALLASRGSLAYLLAEGARGVDLVAIRPSDGVVAARTPLTPGADPMSVYQIAVSARASPDGRSLALYLPRARAMGVFDAATGEIRLLAKGSIAASPTVFTSEPGWFCTTPGGLVYVATEMLSELKPAPHARVLAGPHVPVATTSPDRPIVLLGPDPRNARRITVALMGPAE